MNAILLVAEAFDGGTGGDGGGGGAAGGGPFGGGGAGAGFSEQLIQPSLEPAAFWDAMFAKLNPTRRHTAEPHAQTLHLSKKRKTKSDECLASIYIQVYGIPCMESSNTTSTTITTTSTTILLLLLVLLLLLLLLATN